CGAAMLGVSAVAVTTAGSSAITFSALAAGNFERSMSCFVSRQTAATGISGFLGFATIASAIALFSCGIGVARTSLAGSGFLGVVGAGASGSNAGLVGTAATL